MCRIINTPLTSFYYLCTVSQNRNSQMLRRIAILSIILCLSMAAKAQDDEEYVYSDPVGDSLVREYAVATSDTARLRLCKAIGKKSVNLDTVIKYSSIGISLAEGRDSSDLATCYAALGWGYDIKGNDILAIDNYKKAVDIFKSIGDVNNYVLYSVNLSWRYGDIRDYRKMWQSLFDALKLAQQNTDTINICYCYSTISNAYNELSLTQQAIEAATKAFQLSSLLNKYDEMGNAAVDLSIIYGSVNDDSVSLRESIRWVFRALECFDKCEDLNEYFLGSKCDAYMQMVRSYLALGEIEGKSSFVDSAAYYFNENKSMFNSYGAFNVNFFVSMQDLKALLKKAKGDYRGAAKLLEETIEFAEEKDIRMYADYLYEDLSKIYDNLGDYRNALKYYELYREDAEQRSGIRVAVEAAVFETRYKVEKERELAEEEKINAQNELKDSQRYFHRARKLPRCL